MLQYEEDFELEISNFNVSEYILNLTGGTLKQPSDFIFGIAIHAYKIFSTLISENFETLFLKSAAQKYILKQLVINKIQVTDESLNIKCHFYDKYMLDLLNKTSDYSVKYFFQTTIK